MTQPKKKKNHRKDENWESFVVTYDPKQRSLLITYVFIVKDNIYNLYIVYKVYII